MKQIFSLSDMMVIVVFGGTDGFSINKFGCWMQGKY